MRLILIRHGPAGSADPERWPDDGERPLSESGVRRMRLAARGIARMERGIQVILTSPLARALETARLLGDRLPDARVEAHDVLRPGHSPRRVMDMCASLDGVTHLALVGHEPDLGKLAGTIAFGAPSPMPFKKAGACAFDFDAAPKAGGGRLLWFLPPRALRRLSGRKRRA
ncbi:MAG: phosphohistidine phosphatase SixA [Candidatus Eisenbacteria bacterium]|nr:phosphohistidine phosphatase SixA [Candidatus Eisenbacteria bacterium]